MSVVNIALIAFFALVFIALIVGGVTAVVTIARYCRPVDDDEE